MKIAKHLFAVFLAGCTAWFATVHAQDKPQPPVGVVSVATMADGEIKKVDRETKKITIKHGEIKNLDMPGMTMVFQIRDVAFLETFKAGDKVKFIAEKLEGAFVVTSMQFSK